MSAILRSFIAQALERKPEVLQHIFNAMVESSEVKLQSITRILALLRDVLEPFDNVKIVIDGLDECPDAIELTKSLLKLVKVSTLNLDLLFFSRQEPALERVLADSSSLAIAPRDTQTDLSLYLDKSIVDFRHLLDSENEAFEIKNTILHQAVST
jgi:hypothetical protein